MWSLGCIIAELYTGIPIFPGESEQDQLACIMEIIGVPPRYLIEQSSRRKVFFGMLRLGSLVDVIDNGWCCRFPRTATAVYELTRQD